MTEKAVSTWKSDEPIQKDWVFSAPSFSKEADALARSVAAHKDNDRALELATSIGLNHAQYATAKIIQLTVAKDERWMNQRSPHGLMVDCIYLVAKNAGIKVSAQRMRTITMSMFNVGTQPRPNKWQDEFSDVLGELL